MRLFVAVVPPEPVLDEVAAGAEPVRARWPDLRWTVRAQWHLTLAFLGQVDAEVVPGLADRLGRAAVRHRPLRLGVGGAGRFGGQVLWLGVRGDTAPLARLATSVAAGSRRAGVAVETRPYTPHLTLARARRPMDLRAPVSVLRGFAGSPWVAADIVLVRSWPQARAGAVPAYETVGRWPLGG